MDEHRFMVTPLLDMDERDMREAWRRLVRAVEVAPPPGLGRIVVSEVVSEKLDERWCEAPMRPNPTMRLDNRSSFRKIEWEAPIFCEREV